MDATQILILMEAEYARNYTEDFGIRRMHHLPAVGERLERSWVWDDGDCTDERLAGTCAAEIRRFAIASVQQALDWIADYNFGSPVLALVGGVDAGSHDTLEPGACLLKDAIVLAVWIER